jgi:fluoride exporter
MSFLWVFLGGGFGSVIRYMIGIAFFKTNIHLPIATLLANIVSCLIFASTLWMFREKPEVPAHIRQLMLIGLCGGMSTFSAFSFETFELFKNQQHMWALGNILLNTLLCISIFYIFSKLT